MFGLILETWIALPHAVVGDQGVNVQLCQLLEVGFAVVTGVRGDEAGDGEGGASINASLIVLTNGHHSLDRSDQRASLYQCSDVDAGGGLGQDAGMIIFRGFLYSLVRVHMLHTDDQIVSGYYQHQQTQADEDFWAWEEVDELCHELSSGLRITQKLIESAPSDWSLALIGAGPLEDLVYRFKLPAVNAIAAIAEKSERMQRAMRSVNIDEDQPALEAIWDALLNNYRGDVDALSQETPPE